MPRRLSDPEWLQFLSDVDVTALGLPPWGGVVEWNGQLVLVFICQGAGTVCQKGEVMLTDVSDRPDLLLNLPRTYDTASGLWIYQLPQETMARLYEVGRTTLEATGKIVQTVAEQTGQAAGALTGPLLQQLAVPLALVAVLYLVMTKR